MLSLHTPPHQWFPTSPSQLPLIFPSLLLIITLLNCIPPTPPRFPLPITPQCPQPFLSSPPLFFCLLCVDVLALPTSPQSRPSSLPTPTITTMSDLILGLVAVEAACQGEAKAGKVRMSDFFCFVFLFLPWPHTGLEFLKEDFTRRSSVNCRLMSTGSWYVNTMPLRALWKDYQPHERWMVIKSHVTICTRNIKPHSYIINFFLCLSITFCCGRIILFITLP